jgi:hypothetical protein
MLGSFRPRIFAALVLSCATLFAAPAVAAEAEAAPVASTASVASLPNLASIVREQTAQTLSDEAKAAAERATLAAASAAAALPGLPGGRPLKDLVIGFVDFGNQDEEQLCLAKAVYFEARSESLEGQLAVAEVVLNRARSGVYPPSICGVVTQHAQFSFIRAGRFPAPNTASDAWHKALAIAEIANKHLATEVAPNVLWYHADYVAPAWGRQRTRVAQVGRHIFYS